MTLPSSGQLSLSSIRTELATSGTLNLGNSASRSLSSNISGAVKVSDFYNKQKDVACLFHFSQVNGSQIFTDARSTYIATPSSANTIISTDTAKFNTSSLYCNNSYLNFSSDRTDLASWAGNFTIELWVYHVNGAAGVSRYMSYGPEDASIRRATSLNYETYDLYGGGYYGLSTAANTVGMNQWVHLAKVRNGSTITLYVNGASVGSYSYTAGVRLSAFSLGCVDPEYFQGYIDEVRISTIAQYTTNFTPPTTAFA